MEQALEQWGYSSARRSDDAARNQALKAAMARRTQLFAREATGGRPAAAVHHSPVDTLEDLWLKASSRPGCAEVIDMGHAGSVREERITVETDASVRELSRRLRGPNRVPG